MHDIPVVLESGDRFHRVISSGDIAVPADPPYTSVICFFAILRMSGEFDVVCLHKIFEHDGSVRRTAQTKVDIGADDIEADLEAIRSAFGGGVEEATGIAIEWRELDLSDVADPEEQMRRMEAWPGLRAWRAEG